MPRKLDDFWEYADRLKKDRFKCRFCEREFSGTAPRVKSHLSGIKGGGVDICTEVPKDIQSAAAEAIKGVSKRPKLKHFTSNSDQSSSEVCQKNDGRGLDNLLLNFLLSNNIDCSVVQSPSFIDFMNAVAASGAPCELPSYSTLRTQLIPNLLGEIEVHVRSVKESWGETGCTLISDIWSDEKANQSLVNIMAYSWKGLLLLNSFKVPKDELDSSFLEVIICHCIQTIGPNNVVQYINGAQGGGPTKALLKNNFPHIYITRCIATEIQSCFEEVYREIEWVKVAFDEARCLIGCIYGHSSLLSLMRKYTKNRELIQPQTIDFSSNYSMLLSVLAVKDQLIQLVQSPEWLLFGCNMPDLVKEVADMIDSLEFWNQVEEILKALQSLFLVLHLVDRYGSSSGYLYMAMEMATEEMGRIYYGNTDKYQGLWRIFNSLKGRIVHPIHAATAFLNPEYMCGELFKDKAKVTEVMEFVVSNLVANEDKVAFVEEIRKYHQRGREPKLLSDLVNTMRTTYHPCDWWDYCGGEFPKLKKYAIRLLSQPCSSSACKRSLSAFQTAHIKKPRGFTLFEASSNDLSWMNVILITRFNARNASDKPMLGLSKLDLMDLGFSNQLFHEEELPHLDLCPSHSSVIAVNHCPSQKHMQLHFVNRIPSRLVTGQEVKSEHGSAIHVFLVDPTTGNVVQNNELSTLNLKISVLEGDFDEEVKNIWTREDLERNEIITDFPLIHGSLQVTLKGGMGRLGDIHFVHDSTISRSGTFKLGLKTLPDEHEGIWIGEGISNAFIVEDSNVTKAPDAAPSQTHLLEDSVLMSFFSQMTPLACPMRTTVSSEMDCISFWGPTFSPGVEYKHKQKHNVKSGQAAMRWLKLKAILQWAILRRIVMKKRAQKMLMKARMQKRLEEWNKGQVCSTEEYRLLLGKEKLGKDNWKVDISRKYVMSKAPSQVTSLSEEYSDGGLDEKDVELTLDDLGPEEQLELANADNSTLGGSAAFPKPSTVESSQPLTLFQLSCNDVEVIKDKEAVKPFVREACPSTMASSSCVRDSSLKHDSKHLSLPLTLFPSLLSADDGGLGEGKGEDSLKHTAGQSKSPAKVGERIGMSKPSIVGWSCVDPEEPNFVSGLEMHLMELKACLLGRSDVTLTVLACPGGCGKTTLIQKLCHDEEIKGHFGDRIYFVNISGIEHVKGVVQRILQHMKHPIAEFQSDEDALNQLEQCLRSTVSKVHPVQCESPILLVLDDVWRGAKALLEKLQLQIESCKILVTSRSTEYLPGQDAMTLFDQAAALPDERADIPDEIEKVFSKSMSSDSLSSSAWTPKQNRMFERALAQFNRDTPERWQKMARVVGGKSAEEVRRHYEVLIEDLKHIESGKVPVPERPVHQRQFQLSKRN